MVFQYQEMYWHPLLSIKVLTTIWGPEWHQFTSQLPAPLEFQFSFSPKGLTCRELGIAWVIRLCDLHIQEIFFVYFSLMDMTLRYMLVFSSHNSVLPTSLFFTIYHLIQHTFYNLQMLSFSCHCSITMEKRWICLSVEGTRALKKANVLPLYIKAKKQVYTLNNIPQAFLAAGIVPLNPHIIFLKLTSTSLKLPTVNILPSVKYHYLHLEILELQCALFDRLKSCFIRVSSLNMNP